MATVTLTYNTGANQYNFSPVPFLNVTKQFQKTPDGTLIGTLTTATLAGTLVSVPTGGLVYIDNLQDTLRSKLNEDGKLLRLTCDGYDILSVYPRINSIQFGESNNNWVFTSPYTIDLEWDEDHVGSGENSGIMPPFVNDASESWDFEFLGERFKYSLTTDAGLDTNSYQFKLSHSLSARGKRHYTSGGVVREAWEEARDFVIPRLGYDSTKIQSSGTFNLNPAQFGAYNHMRTEQIGELDGNYAVTETWVVVNPTGSGIAGLALEDFTCSVRSNTEDSISSVSIEGTIVGLEQISYGTNPGDFTVTVDKYSNALSYWNNVNGPLKLYPRAKAISNLTLNSTPKTQVVTHNPPRGEITYSFEYDSRPSNCITGSLSEVFVVTDENPADMIAIITVLGRSAGQLLQDLSTTTARKRSVDIEVVMSGTNICPNSAGNVTLMMAASPASQVDTIVAAFEAELENNYAQVFRTQDQSRWEPKTGRYGRNIQFTYANCE